MRVQTSRHPFVNLPWSWALIRASALIERRDYQREIARRDRKLLRARQRVGMKLLADASKVRSRTAKPVERRVRSLLFAESVPHSSLIDPKSYERMSAAARVDKHRVRIIDERAQFAVNLFLSRRDVAPKMYTLHVDNRRGRIYLLLVITCQ